MQWRRAAAALALLAAGACSGDDGLIEVQAITGLLDCPTAEFSYSTGD